MKTANLKANLLSFCFLSLVMIFSSSNVQAEIQTKEITYTLNDVELTGYMAWDDSNNNKRPGVLVVHEWWGHNDYARKRARDLAEAGYVGFALDMYGDKKVASHPEDAGKFMNEIMSRYDEMLARFKAGEEQLKQSEVVDKNKIAAIGYCFGGAVVLNVARSENDLAGVVSFHGSLDPVQQSDTEIDTPMLVQSGADDPFVKPESIDNFKKEMKTRKANYEFVRYPHAKHGFTNPGATEIGQKFGLPLEYNREADQKSWDRMLKFFNKIFA